MGVILLAFGALVGVGVLVARKSVAKKSGGTESSRGGGQATTGDPYIDEIIRTKVRSARPGAVLNAGVATTAATAIIHNQVALERARMFFPFIKEGRGDDTSTTYGGSRYANASRNALCLRDGLPAGCMKQPRTQADYEIAIRSGIQVLGQNRPFSQNDGTVCAEGVLVWQAEYELRRFVTHGTPTAIFDIGAVNRIFSRVWNRNDSPRCVDILEAALLGLS